MTSRRARTRELIELGGLLRSSGLVDLAGGDRVWLSRCLRDLADALRPRETGPSDPKPDIGRADDPA